MVSDEITALGVRWGMADQDDQLTQQSYDAAAFWYHRATEESRKNVVSWIIRCQHEGRCGFLLMSGDGERRPYPVPKPSKTERPKWLSYRCSFYASADMEFWQVQATKITGIDVGPAAEFFRMEFVKEGMADKWDLILETPNLQWPSRMLPMLGIRTWKIYVAGPSWLEYGGLDVFETNEGYRTRLWVICTGAVWWERDPTIQAKHWYMGSHIVEIEQDDEESEWSE